MRMSRRLVRNRIEQNEVFNCDDISQENQYILPYHYIPSLKNGNFKQHLYWSWGYHYIGGMELVLGILKEISFNSLLDVGCGDGRFLKEVSQRFPEKKLLGIDCSERAINIAKALNPHISYKCLDLCFTSNLEHIYDVVTMIEVLEHIKIDQVHDFVTACANQLNPNGKLILTIPHKNKPLQAKHCQHFDSIRIRKILTEYFEIDRIVFFDKMSTIWSRLIAPLFCNSLYILNNRFLLKTLYSIYQKFFFWCNEENCGRICVVAHKK